MFSCIQSFAKCNRHVEIIDKRHHNLTSFPNDVIRYYRTLEELFLDSNQLNELPKVFIRYNADFNRCLTFFYSKGVL